MKHTGKSTAAVAAGIGTAAFCVLWFFVPVATGPGTSVFPALMPLVLGPAVAGPLTRILLFGVYLVPLFAVLTLASLFWADRMGPFGDAGGITAGLLRILVSGLMVFADALPALLYADTPEWFARMEVGYWIMPLLAVAAQIFAVAYLLRVLNLRNPVYREYREFRNQQRRNLPATAGSVKITAAEILFRIRVKLFFAFIGLISVILLVLSGLLLQNYRTTIVEAVGDGARNQVEQASANYRTNLGDTIALHEYFSRQIELNDKATFNYRGLTMYTNLKTEVYLDALPAAMPEYAPEYSTLFPGERAPVRPELPPLTGERAKSLAELWLAQRAVVSGYDSSARTFEFVSPIVKIDTIRQGEQRIKRERLLGFSRMTFDEGVIMRPYYRTRVVVIIFTAAFLYLAIILTIVIGNYIVNPLLFLRMNVRKISDVLSGMIRGKTRVSATGLVYQDGITSRDEIKSLSSEINDMVTVIRGIVPYISASTLKQAERGTASSTQKELAFLFTDIRGFTTLSEGLAPDEVVAVLNRYLDLETEIILNNHGDVDKFVGDEMMAFFEGPEKERNACLAAMQIRHAMMAEKDKREKAGLPVVNIGIGINAGPVVFGSVGARDRMDFTSIGDTVNLAARLEGANKAYGSKTLITEAVHRQVTDLFLCRELDYLAVKGKNEPVRIYEILQELRTASPKLKRIRDNFELGLGEYRRRNWEQAAVHFKKNMAEFQDAPSEVYAQRVQHFLRNPPARDWDGVFRMTVK